METKRELQMGDLIQFKGPSGDSEWGTVEHPPSDGSVTIRRMEGKGLYRVKLDVLEIIHHASH